MADIWKAGQLTAIYTPVGKNASGQLVYRRAPFDIMLWSQTDGGDPEFFVNTVGFSSVDSASVNLLSDADAVEAGHEFGFYTLDQYVVEPHQADGDNDDWHSINHVGFI